MMTGLHSPWPLFSDDLDLARSWLRPQLRNLVSLRTGHLAISLGLGDALLDRVQSGELQAEAKALRQWNFRIARLHGEANPYRHLLPKRLLDHILDAIEQSKTTGDPLTVRMEGGIGDHLEALSLFVPWAQEQKCCLNLEMAAERRQQIKPLLPQSDQIRCTKKLEQGKNLIATMALRAAVVSSTQPAPQYRPLLTQSQTKQTSQQHWLCCWRAEGAGDRLSAHSRSIPWSLAREFYLHLKNLQPQCCIVDITNWRGWEASQLRGIGVEILDPRQRTLLELSELCRVSRVVTIDTALVHLCAAAGQRADLLLNAFPDERWQELHRPEHHYGQLIQLWQSSQFGSWSAVLASLTDTLSVQG